MHIRTVLTGGKRKHIATMEKKKGQDKLRYKKEVVRIKTTIEETIKAGHDVRSAADWMMEYSGPHKRVSVFRTGRSDNVISIVLWITGLVLSSSLAILLSLVVTVIT